MHSRALKLAPTDKLLLRNQMGSVLYLLSHKLVRLYTPKLNKLKVTYPQFLVMSALWETDGLLVTEIGRILRLETGSLTPLLQRLEKLGFLERRRLEDDRRKVGIFLTSKGIKLYHQASEHLLPLKVFAKDVGCTAEFVEHTRKVLEEMLARLDQLPLHHRDGI